jgi:cytochrome bd-type quinol oxidase subunit 2
MKHRLFEWGYLIIMVLNSLIMIGVSLHSRIWSMTYKTDQELGVPVRWPWLLVAIILITGLAILVLWLDRKDDSRIFVTIIEIVGYICSFFFGMIVLN